MSGPRLERILASTALALILAAPIGASAMAQEAGAPSATPAPPTQAAAAAGGAPRARRPPATPPPPPPPPPTPQPAAAPARRRGAAAERGGTGRAAKEAGVPTAATDPAAASEQAAAPDPLAALDPADRAVAEKIRDLLAAKTDTIFANKRERAAVEAFYQARHLAPLWLDKGVQNARAPAVIARLKD